MGRALKLQYGMVAVATAMLALGAYAQVFSDSATLPGGERGVSTAAAEGARQDRPFFRTSRGLMAAPARVMTLAGRVDRPGRGRATGGPGSACTCDSDCGDGNTCTTDTCVGGICEQVFALGMACDATNHGDTTFCTQGQCDAAGVCLNNDAGGSPCDDGAGGTETCNEVADRCDGIECTVASDCPPGGEDPVHCILNSCVEGRCVLQFACADGEYCDVPGLCLTVTDGRCCVDLAACGNTTLVACDNGGGPGSGPWSIGDGSCLCPKASWGINDNAGAEFVFSISAAESCTVGGVAGAADFNIIGDDYALDNSAFLLLEEFRFVGGVGGDGDRTAIFEFWDGSVDPPVLADALSITFPAGQTEVAEWIITLAGGEFVIPPVGWVTMRPETGGGETVTWLSTNEIGAIGDNNINLMWADDDRRDVLLPIGPNILAFELTGTKINPQGHCCLGEGNCNDTTLNVVWLCEDAGGTFVPDEATCPVGACAQATCCFGDGTCQVLDPAACTSGGGTVGIFGATCDLNCCPQVLTAGDTCGSEIGQVLDTATAGVGVPVTARYSGDSSGATNGHCSVTTSQTCNSFIPSGGPEPDSCPDGEPCVLDEVCLPVASDSGHWEAFTITAPSTVEISYCCSGANDTGAACHRWIVVVDDCMACTRVFRDGASFCADGNPGDVYTLDAGTYHYSVFSGRSNIAGPEDSLREIDLASCGPGKPPPVQEGPYELLITATRLPFVTCCFGDTCVDGTSPNPLNTLECEAQGGFELVGVSACFGDPCAGGACCQEQGICTNVSSPTGASECAALGGTYVGGADCAFDAPCPTCPLDDLVIGGPECQANNGNWYLNSDRNSDPPTAWADDFMAASGGPMTQVCFEVAYYVVKGQVCCADVGSQLPDMWNITVFHDAAGLPGAEIGPPGGQILQNVVSGPPSPCIQSKSGAGLTGITLVAGECYWIEITGLGEGPIGNPPQQGCSTGLLNSEDGNNYMVSGSPGVYTLDGVITSLANLPVADLAFCVEGGMLTCNRDAACCINPGGAPPLCQMLSPADCLAAKGIFLPGEACVGSQCPGSCEAETCPDQISLNAPGEACESGLPCARPYSNAFCNNSIDMTPCGQQGADTWYSYTTGPDECGNFTISACGGDYDGFLSIYDGGPNCDCPIDESMPLACDDDFCGANTMPQVTFPANADTCYLIRAGGWSAETGTGTLTLSTALPPNGCAITAPEPVLPDDAFDVIGASVACGTDIDCTNEAICRNGSCYVPKNRFVSVQPNPANAGILTARRVCVDAPGPGDHCHWADVPVLYSPLGPGPLPVLISDLVEAPVYRDWSLDPVDSQGRTVVHISGCPVSPLHAYLIQSIHQGADINNEANYSPVTVLPTVATWGDVSGGGAPSLPPDGVVNPADIQQAVFGFQNNQVAPKTWLKVGATSSAVNPTSIDLAEDVFRIVEAFQGATYPGLPPAECVSGGPSQCPVGSEPTAWIKLVPVRASGVEGVDWSAGPGPNDITLAHGGQDVVVEVFVTNLGADDVAAYQLGLDCSYAFSVAGDINPYSAECQIAGLAFDSGVCLGVDGSRADYILADAAATIVACNTVDLCGAPGSPGRFICGAILVAGTPGSGPGDHYGATFGFAVSADAEGVVAVGVDLDPTRTMLADSNGCSFVIENVAAGNIIIASEIGSCCGDPNASLFCADSMTADQCGAVGGSFTAGGVCAGVEGPVPGLDAACFACDDAVPDEIECDDGDPCTADSCANGTCFHAAEPRLCCNPTDGAVMLIDDENPCTDDVCDPLTGQVTHLGNATTSVCAAAIGSRFLGITPPCGLAGGCDDAAQVALFLSVEIEPGVMIDLGFIQTDGTIGADPVFATASSWGTLNLSGGFIRPSTTYVVTLVPIAGLTGSTSSSTTAVYADLDGNGVINFSDIQIGAMVFQGNPLFVPLLADVDPCIPNHVVTLAGDVFAIIRAFQGETFEAACPLGVCCFFPTNPNSCGPSGLFGTGELEEECPPPGVWTEGGECGPLDECP